MTRKSFSIVLIIGLALLLSVGSVAAQDGVQPESPAGVEAVVGATITYQGVLNESGSPVTGSRDMTFRFYTNSTCTTAVGSMISKPGVAVTNGLFSTSLTVDATLLNGQALWLAVTVGGTQLACQSIAPVPYALSLRPGAIISDTNSKGWVNRYESLTNHSEAAALYGSIVDSPSAYVVSNAIWGEGGDAGVYGHSSSGHGVYGKSDDADHAGVLATGLNNGVDLELGATSTTDDDGVISSSRVYTDSDLVFETKDQVSIVLDEDRTGDDDADFFVFDGGTALLNIDDSGETTIYADSGIVNPTLRLYERGNDYARLDFANNQTGGREWTIAGYPNATATSAWLNFWFSDGSGGGENIVSINGNGGMNLVGNLNLLSATSGQVVVQLGEGLDYAEGFDVSTPDRLEPGTVLVIDPDHPGELKASAMAYDSKVAGIIAGANDLGSGVRLGAGQFDYDVALAGRVYCFVDATEAAIEPGDMLTTSATPGYAMKVGDPDRAQGAVLGKAMQKLEKGQKGLILVLVTLQ
jgi:hypothetical protein